MDLSKLFEMQKALDDHIMNTHPELKGQNNLDWKILALQVELGECANEWRGFKKWSNDQEPRISVKCVCAKCEGTGTWDYGDGNICNCENCNGTGKLNESNPLLEEYVDGLHFILSIGLELGIKEISINTFKQKSIIQHFNALFNCISTLAVGFHDNYQALFSAYIGLGEMLGFTWEQVEAAYMEKNAVNHARQESGY